MIKSIITITEIHNFEIRSMDENNFRRKNKATANLKTGRFDYIESAVINHQQCKQGSTTLNDYYVAYIADNDS